MCLYALTAIRQDHRLCGVGWKIMLTRNEIVKDKLVLVPAFGNYPKRQPWYRLNEEYTRNLAREPAWIDVWANHGWEPEYVGRYEPGFHVYRSEEDAWDILKYIFQYHNSRAVVVKVWWSGLVCAGIETPDAKMVRLGDGVNVQMKWLVNVEVVNKITPLAVYNFDGDDISSKYDAVDEAVDEAVEEQPEEDS
jgi:hypothetical protein